MIHEVIDIDPDLKAVADQIMLTRDDMSAEEMYESAHIVLCIVPSDTSPLGFRLGAFCNPTVDPRIAAYHAACVMAALTRARHIMQHTGDEHVEATDA